MKNLPLGVILFLIVACSSNLGYNEAIERNNQRFPSGELRGDALFIVEAKSYSILLHELGSLAIEAGYASAIQSFGTQIKNEHEVLNNELRQLAKNNKFKLPQEMSESHKQVLEEVKNASRQDFDRQFIRAVERIYEDNTELYKRIATTGQKDEIRAFAAKKLSLLRSNQQRADELEDELI